MSGKSVGSKLDRRNMNSDVATGNATSVTKGERDPITSLGKHTSLQKEERDARKNCGQVHLCARDTFEYAGT